MSLEDNQHKSTVAQKEEEILSFWNKNNIFQKVLEKKSPKGNFVFYDGPPFATGLPHYGHLLASIIKDAIPRYKTMQGYCVRRQWGWDCHGLPIENLVESELGLERKKDIEKLGVEEFNAAAKNSVLRYDSEWKKIIPRIGRWVDMEDSYRTMDVTYTESIWWAFKTLYEKKLVYEGYKSMHVCPRCETTLAVSEVSMGYKEITDISVIAKFELEEESETYFLAWTTTPWTLPGNVALAVGEEIEYVKVKFKGPALQSVSVQDKGEIKRTNISPGTYILSKDIFWKSIQSNTSLSELSKSLFPEHLKDSKEYAHNPDGFFEKYSDKLILIKGKELIGKKYKPLFPYYSNAPDIKNKENGWKVYGALFVNTEEGTGIVHVAPAFGEDDMELGKVHNLPFIQHVNIDGTFKSEVKDFSGMAVKPKHNHQATDIEIIKYLAQKSLLFNKEKITHTYPFCWRCDTPLLNYAASSWFVKVTTLKPKLLSVNKKITWVPSSIQYGRFGKWLEGARDWAVSRSRFWGAPIPVWKCTSCKEVEVIGSIAEIQDKTKGSNNTYYVMRHGEAKSNRDGFVASEINKTNTLTEEGKKVALASAKDFKDKHIDMIFSSPLLRTKQTAEIAALQIGIAKKDIVVDERLEEIRFGDFEGKSSSAYHSYFSSLLEKFTKRPEGGENILDVKKRVGRFLHHLESTYHNKTILIVTHESPAWQLFSVAEGWDITAAVKAKSSKGDFIKTGAVLSLTYRALPRNTEHELDLHRPFIDDVEFPCRCGGVMKRIPEVFDCWFESGSMPFAQFHYPFKNKKVFKKNFPADFIAEGLDQTRGWFYSMLVLSVGLFGKSAYNSVIVNGLILAEDGQKMSKRLKNYPDPTSVINSYGADALRYYMLCSPLMRGENLNFSKKDIQEVMNKVVVRLRNVHAFYTLYSNGRHVDDKPDHVHILDTWICVRLSELINKVTQAMEQYELDRAVRPIGEFIDDISTWYIRRSRDRFKEPDTLDGKAALATTRFVLTELTKIMAPFTPFIAEEIYGNIRRENEVGSVHEAMWPKEEPTIPVWPNPMALFHRLFGTHKDLRVLSDMERVRELVSLALEARQKLGIKVRQPLLELKIKKQETRIKNNKQLIDLIKDEVNVRRIVFGAHIENDIEFDSHITEELRQEGQLRELIRHVQDLRKKEGFFPAQKVNLFVKTDSTGKAFIEMFEQEFKKSVSLSNVSFADTNGKHVAIGDLSFTIALKK